MKCASQGGHLVIIDAAHENSFVRQYLAEYRSKRLDFFCDKLMRYGSVN